MSSGWIRDAPGSGARYTGHSRGRLGLCIASGVLTADTMGVNPRVHVIPSVAEMLADSASGRPFLPRPPRVERGDGNAEVVRYLGGGGEWGMAPETLRSMVQSRRSVVRVVHRFLFWYYYPIRCISVLPDALALVDPGW